MPKVIEKKLIEQFEGREYFTRNELFEFYLDFEPDLKEGTFGWRIYDLKSKNIIKAVGRGLYVISYKPRYKPEISKDLLKLARVITENFSDIKSCLWETAWLTEFHQHQTNRSTIIVETEKGFEESIYFELKDSSRRDVYFNPNEKTIDFYITESERPVIIKKLITRSPISSRTEKISERSEKKVKFYTPSLEKILVDLFADEKLYFYLQGSEMIHIYENAIRKYTINFTKLFSYAKRRKREKDIKSFLNSHMPHLVQELIDD